MVSYFFLIFAITIAITRLVLYIRPIASPAIGGFQMHHYMYGIVGIVTGLLFHSIIVYAIGLGLFVDELTYLFIQGKNHKDNYSRTSLLGTALIMLLIFLFQNYLLIPFGV